MDEVRSSLFGCSVAFICVYVCVLVGVKLPTRLADVFPIGFLIRIFFFNF